MTEIIETTVTTQTGRVISCRHVDGKEPCVVFMHGTLSDKNASKSLFLQTFCMENGQAFCAFDFTGHGESSGQYTDATIGIWLQDALTVLDKVVKGKALLVGSSMGGWIMLLAALLRPERVAACLGVAAAPDFTLDVWASFTDEQKNAIQTKGVIYTPNGWTEQGDPWTYALFLDAQNYLVTNRKIQIACPVVLLHGDKDDCVPLASAFKIKDAVTSGDVQVVIQKNGTHRFSSPEELDLVKNAVKYLLKKTAV